MKPNFSPSKPHVVLFPFMSKGHIIPHIHLAHLLLRRNIAITIFTTPKNRPFILSSLSATDAATIIDLPFPENIPEIPPNIENTDTLPSLSLLANFANATKLMQPHFEKELEKLPPISFVVSDGFLGWTLASSSKFGVPRLALFGTNQYNFAVSRDSLRLFPKIESDDEVFTLPSFQWVELTKNDFDTRVRDTDPEGANVEFIMDIIENTSKSYGELVNSFYELEPAFVDYWNSFNESKTYCIGPLCLVDQVSSNNHALLVEKKPEWIQFLDQKLFEKKPVLYVAFGSQADMSKEQFNELAIGLERSDMNFLWVLKERGCELEDGYESRVKLRGIIVKEWVNQREILGHEAVKGFLSHCGWNSCLESICAFVPILAWPLMNDQHLNARFVVEEIKIGLRVETCNMSVRGFVKWVGLAKMMRELMEGERGETVRLRVKEVGKKAWMAMENGGSSQQTLDQILDQLCKMERV